MNKDLIKQRFGRKISVYEENAGIQKQMAEKLLSFINETYFEHVLEIGSGTGLLTKRAAEKLEFQTYTANDIVEKSEEYIKKINKDIHFVSADIEEYLKETDKKYDLILSNAALQWIDDFLSFSKILTEKLNKNGMLLFSVFGQENFREINYVTGKSLKYYTKADFEHFFENYNVCYEEEIRILAFKTPKDVLRHIQLTGVNAVSNESWTKKNLLEFERGYQNFCSNHPTLTYHPQYIKVVK